MKYTKPAISFIDQLEKLKLRGLIVKDEAKALNQLSNLSFYRLRAYTFPYQDNKDPNHPFIKNVSFDEIIQLYNFDSQLRSLVFAAIEKIEIALRTQIIYQWAMKRGSHWQYDESLFKDIPKFKKHIKGVDKEINRSNETFIKHYKNTYTIPKEPPCWMGLEVASFGSLSLLYKNLKNCTEKKKVAKHFGLPNSHILENWMHNFSHVRNICAHHGRLWNRRITVPLKLPKKPINAFLLNKRLYPYKLYPSLSAMLYILNIINKNTLIKSDLISLFNTKDNSIRQEKEMGFPKDWRKEDLWK